MFSHSGANGPESKTMFTFGHVCQVLVLVAKSVISGCILYCDVNFRKYCFDVTFSNIT